MAQIVKLLIHSLSYIFAEKDIQSDPYTQNDAWKIAIEYSEVF